MELFFKKVWSVCVPDAHLRSLSSLMHVVGSGGNTLLTFSGVIKNTSSNGALFITVITNSSAQCAHVYNRCGKRYS